VVNGYQNVPIIVLCFEKKTSYVKCHTVKLIPNGNALKGFWFKCDVASSFDQLALFAAMHNRLHIINFTMPKILLIYFSQCSPFTKMANFLMQI